jgi:hypothetical protein
MKDPVVHNCMYTADLHNLPEESLGQVPKFYLRSAKDVVKTPRIDEKRRNFFFATRFPGDSLIKMPTFFLRHTMDYLGHNGDKGQVMQIGYTVVLGIFHVLQYNCTSIRT